MAGVAQVGRVGRRIMQRIWDPEPVNNRNANEPVWCLGCSYTMNTKRHDTAKTTPPDEAVEPAEEEGRAPSTASSTSHTPHESAVSSVGDSPPEDDIHVNDGGWPQEFLDDFESRIWMTYRTGFEVIPMSTDARVASALSLTMRLRTSFGEQTGFSSDTGWGCMIRSGQSLLANAILITRLGRGMSVLHLSSIATGTLTLARLETKQQCGRRTRHHFVFCRRPFGPILYSQLCQARRGCVW